MKNKDFLHGFRIALPSKARRAAWARESSRLVWFSRLLDSLVLPCQAKLLLLALPGLETKFELIKKA